MQEYLVVFERSTDGGYGAFVPDLPGCVATGKTEAEVRERIREALQWHVEAILQDGDELPAPTAFAERVTVGVPA